MRRWLRFGIAAIVVAAMFVACGGEEEEAGTASPAATPARTAAPAATKTATATAQPSTPAPTVVAGTPTPRPPAPTPEPPTQETRQPEWAVSQVPSGTQVDVVLEDGLGNTYTIVSVDPQWTQLERWGVDSVVDLDADGVEDVIVFHFTGGAHCCSEYLIFSEGPGGIQQDDAFGLGNGGIGTVEDLDGDGVPELDGSDDRLAYFPDLSYAASPSLPLVLCRSTDGTYSDCTTRFPQKLQESADEFEGHLRDAVQRQAEEIEKRYAALGLLASYMRMGMDEEGWSKVGSLCPECESWLGENVSELAERLRYMQPVRPIGQ